MVGLVPRRGHGRLGNAFPARGLLSLLARPGETRPVGPIPGHCRLRGEGEIAAGCRRGLDPRGIEAARNPPGTMERLPVAHVRSASGLDRIRALEKREPAVSGPARAPHRLGGLPSREAVLRGRAGRSRLPKGTRRAWHPGWHSGRGARASGARRGGRGPRTRGRPAVPASRSPGADPGTGARAGRRRGQDAAGFGSSAFPRTGTGRCGWRPTRTPMRTI